MSNKKQPNWLSRLAALLVPLLALAGRVLAQAAPAAGQPEMADALRQNGKIYVVVLVVFIIMTGLLAYLIRLDGKVSRLEREVENR